jgi:hypothetical protein
MNTEILTGKLHPALWAKIDGQYRMTDLYAELFHQFLVGELSRERFIERTGEIEAIYDGQREPF